MKRFFLSSSLISIIIIASCSGGGSSAPTATTSKPAMGIDLDFFADWSPLHFFADQIKQSRAFGTTANATVPVAADPNGWPQGDASIIVATAAGHFENSTPYKLSFAGTATLSCDGCTVANQTTAANTTSADVIMQPGVNVILTFTNTRRLPSDQAPTGVTNVRLISPGYQATDIFNRDFLARLTIFTNIRFMNILGPSGIGSPGNTEVNWSDRTKPGYSVQTNGLAYEYVVLLGNLTGKNVWINIPLSANADYVTKVAQLFAYGSDGDLPYTGPNGSMTDPAANPRPAPANPAYPPLNSNLKLFVEYSNEIWNVFDYPANSNQNIAYATSEYTAGNPYGYSVDQNLTSYLPANFQMGLQREMRKILEISDSFRAVFGNSMMTRVRPVFASQFQNWPLFTIPLDYAASRGYSPLSNRLYGVATAVYITVNDEENDDTLASASQALDQMQNNLTKAGGFNDGIDQFKALVARYDSNLKFIGYEGGPGNKGAKSYAAKRAAQTDPRMKSIILNLFHHWYSSGGDLIVYHSLCNSWDPGTFGFFGLSTDITSEAGPKWDAVKQLAAGQ